jgi:hypothetical protein
MTNKKQRYALLKLKPQTKDIFFIVAQPPTFEHPCEGTCDFDRHLFEEKVCTHEFMPGTRKMIVGNEADPHHIFELVTMVEAASPDDALARLRASGTVGQPDPDGFEQGNAPASGGAE